MSDRFGCEGFRYCCYLFEPASAESLVRSIEIGRKEDFQWLDSKSVHNANEDALAICCKWNIWGLKQLGIAQEEITQKIRSLDCFTRFELVLELPCEIPLLSPKNEDFVFQREMLTDIRGLEEMTSFFEKHGVLVLEDYFRTELTVELIQKLYNIVRDRITEIEAVLKKLGLDSPKKLTHDEFKEVGFLSDNRFDLFHCETSEFPEIIEFGLNAFWLPFVNAILGKRWTLEVSVVYSRNGAPTQRWHQDGSHQENLETPYGLCVFLPLIDIDDAVGCTQFWPGSHMHPAFSQPKVFGQCEKIGREFSGFTSRGSCIFYEYCLMHRGMRNVSSDIPFRPLVHFFYHNPKYHLKRRDKSIYFIQ